MSKSTIQIPYGIKVLNGSPVDSKYLNNNNEPYASPNQVFAEVVAGARHIGLTVNILGLEYWFKDGVTNFDLILKTTSLQEVSEPIYEVQNLEGTGIIYDLILGQVQSIDVIGSITELQNISYLSTINPINGFIIHLTNKQEIPIKIINTETLKLLMQEDLSLRPRETLTLKYYTLGYFMELGRESKKEFIHEQSIASSNWVITHGLNKFPSINILDIEGSMILGEITFLNKNKLKVEFNSDISGKAYLN